MIRSDTPSGRNFRDIIKRRLASVDVYVAQPQELRPWLAEIPVTFAGITLWGDTDGYLPFIVRNGMDEFEVRDRHSPENGGVLTFSRYGLGWKLVAVRWGRQ
jgi:hypothetical protein